MSDQIEVYLEENEQQFLDTVLNAWIQDASGDDPAAADDFKHLQSEVSQYSELTHNNWQLIQKLVAASVDQQIGVSSQEDVEVAKKLMTKLAKET